MNELVYRTAFEKIAEAQVKEAWGGTYYHGTSRAQENAILREGLVPQTSSGQKSSVDKMRRFLQQRNPNAVPVIESTAKIYDPSRVYASRSKNLARVYGVLGDARRRKELLGNIKRKDFKGAVKNFLNYQPLQVDGRDLKLSRDPGHALLAVQGERGAAIPASKITRATPRKGMLRAALRRLLLKR